MITTNNHYTAVVITGIKEEVTGVKTFTLSYAGGTPVTYAAGQFITFVFTHHGREERRSFSISSSAVLEEPLAFTVKRIDNGAYSRMLTDRAQVGDQLFTTGVGGLFTLPDSTQAYKQVFFFAAGIGITPVISLLKTLLHRDEQVQAVLIYSNHSKEDVVFYNEIQTLAARFGDRFKQELLFSNSFNLMRARLSKALLPVIMKEYTTVPKEEVLCYVCGPFPYMRMVIWSLEEWGIKDAHIRKENFNTNDRAVARTEPPDKEPHVVALLHNRQQYSFTVQYPDTILQAAKRQGINLPYSCETGRCGSCAALCTSGKVWLSYNEVLMDSDIKQGAILTCTGYPEGGDVTIEA